MTWRDYAAKGIGWLISVLIAVPLIVISMVANGVLRLLRGSDPLNLVAKRLVSIIRASPAIASGGEVWVYPRGWGRTLQEADDNPPDLLVMVRIKYGRDKYGIRMPADLIFQIFPKTGRHKLHFEAYPHSREYWTIDLRDQHAQRWRPTRQTIGFDGTVCSDVVEGLEFKLQLIIGGTSG